MLVYILIFIIGLCVGSFLNVVIYREVGFGYQPAVERKGWRQYFPAWVFGRSFCDHCGQPLGWYDNLPLFSYLLLKGRCRHCRKEISWQYPVVELLTGLEFVWIYLLIEGNLNFFSRFEGFYSLLSLIIWLVLGACLLNIFVADLKYQLIPNSAILTAIVFALIKIWADYRYTGMIDFSLFAAAAAAGLFIASLHFLTNKKGMGGGDIKLAFLIGLVLGWPETLVSLLLAFLTGALVGGILILIGKKNLKSQIAFGPFLIAGAVFGQVLGEEIWVLLVG